MANKKRWICAATVSFLAISCLAQSFETSLKQNGNLLGASYNSNGPNHNASVSISPGSPFAPASGAGPDSYAISWSLTTFTGAPPAPPDPPVGMVSMFATAVIPAAKIRVSTGGVLSFDLDVSDPETRIAMVTDCRTLPCTTAPLASFPLKGSFSWYTGMGSFASTMTGGYDSRNVDPVCISEQSFSGHRMSGSANFTGTIGPFAAVPPALGSNANMNLNKGTLRLQSVCTPPPPPPPMP